MRKICLAAFAALALGGALLWQGCGSSDKAAPLTSMDQLPSFDVSNYDYASGTANASSSLLSGKRVAGKVGTVGGFTRAGCEAYTAELKMIQDGKRVDAFICYIKKVEAAMGQKLPTDAYGYYEFSFPAKQTEQGPPEKIRCRIGIFNGALKMDACMPSGSTWTRDVEVSIGPKSDGSGYTGTVVNSYTFTENSVSHTGSSRVDVDITGTSTSSFTDATFTGSHNDGPTGDSSQYWKNWAQFQAKSTNHTNAIQGTYSSASTQWGSNTSALIAKWDASKIGTAKYSVTGQYPAPTLEQCRQWDQSGATDEQLNTYCVGKCWQCPNDGSGNCTEVAASGGYCPMSNSGTESFSITAGTPPSFLVVDNGSSSFYSEVNAATVPDLSNLNTAFVDTTFDCNDASYTWTPFDATSADFAECIALEQEDQGLWSMCQNQEDAARNQN